MAQGGFNSLDIYTADEKMCRGKYFVEFSDNEETLSEITKTKIFKINNFDEGQLQAVNKIVVLATNETREELLNLLWKVIPKDQIEIY